MAYRYHNCCITWPKENVFCDGGLNDMIDKAIDITRRTFLKHVNRDDLQCLEYDLGYTKYPVHGLTMAGDGYVSYHRSYLHNRRVYFFNHSSIEYVFTDF